MLFFDIEPKTLADILLSHLKTAVLKDINPFVRGYETSLISRLAADYPQLDRLESLNLKWSDNGWIGADNLYLMAELSEKFGPGLVFLAGSGLNVLLPALDPDRTEELWANLPRLGQGRLTTAQSRYPVLCPLWGPCQGHRIKYEELLWELADELVKEIDDNFAVSLAGCPLDCGLSAESADVCLIMDQEGLGLTVWLGGHHRFGREPVLPQPLAFFDLTAAWAMLDFVFFLHDRWQSLRLPNEETLPEMAGRLGLIALKYPPVTPPNKTDRPLAPDV